MKHIIMFSENYFSKYFIGNDSKVDTPVPIPNTEVKHFNAEDSVSENRKLPIFFCLKINVDKYYNLILIHIYRNIINLMYIKVLY